MSEWISVNDRIPSDGCSVLVYWDDEQNGHSCRVATWWSDERKFGYPCCGHRKALDDVDYWMPLPEPPKGEEP